MDGHVKIWTKFSVTHAGKVVNLRIQELPKDRFEDVLELHMNYFVQEESTFRATGVPKSAEAMAEMRAVISQRINDESFHIVICCLDNDDGKIGDIIGTSMIMLTTPQELLKKKVQPKTEALKKMFEVYGGMLALYDEAKEFNLDHYFIDKGVVVHPDYRGLGIAQEFFKVRRMMCKEFEVPIHGAWMTSYGTQKAAKRDGWETVCEINYDEYGKKHGVIFANGPPTCKFMIARIF